MGASIHDVAKRAGVSPRTVSNVVNDYVHVKPETRARVQAAIDELRYRPNVSARRLRQRNTRTIALAVPELSQPYFAELIDVIERAAQERGYTVIATQTGGSRERERAMLREFDSHIVDGIILSALAITTDDLAELKPSIPIVFIGEQIPPGDVITIAIDNEKALFDVTSHLIASGRRRIAALGASEDRGHRSGQLRLAGYRRAIRDAGLPLDDSLVLHTPGYSRAAGRAAARQAIERDPAIDAFVCFNDVLAIGALRALADFGISVPERVAVTGVDDIDDAAYCVPALTTISPDKGAIALSAVTSLVTLIDEPESGTASIEHAYRLIQRESTTPLG
jgi:DNA-binding LacI/PurR family transcriptional regulator